eukprot:g6053.t1
MLPSWVEISSVLCTLLLLLPAFVSRIFWPEDCLTGPVYTKTVLTNEFQLCVEANGGRVKYSGSLCPDGINIQWDGMEALDRRAGYNASQCTWTRPANDPTWSAQWLGSCGVVPIYVPELGLPIKCANYPCIEGPPYLVEVHTNYTELCVRNTTGGRTVYNGSLCLDGFFIEWQGMKTVEEDIRPGDGLTPAQCTWQREIFDGDWQAAWVGSCGLAPTNVPQLGLPFACPRMMKRNATLYPLGKVAIQSRDATPFGSGSLENFCNETAPGTGTAASGSHCFKNINDGLVGNDFSWISNRLSPSWIEYAGVTWTYTRALQGFCTARDATGGVIDRYAGHNTIQYSLKQLDHTSPDSEWIVLGGFTRDTPGLVCYEFEGDGIMAQSLRVTTDNPAACFDELQIFEISCVTAVIGPVLNSENTPKTIEFNGWYTCPASIAAADVVNATAAEKNSTLTWSLHQSLTHLTASRTDQPGNGWDISLKVKCCGCANNDRLFDWNTRSCIIYCMDANIGTLLNAADSPKTIEFDGHYICPLSVRVKDVGGTETERNSSDTWSLQQNATHLTVARSDPGNEDGSWGLNLQVQCCKCGWGYNFDLATKSCFLPSSTPSPSVSPSVTPTFSVTPSTSPSVTTTQSTSPTQSSPGASVSSSTSLSQTPVSHSTSSSPLSASSSPLSSSSSSSSSPSSPSSSAPPISSSSSPSPPSSSFPARPSSSSTTSPSASPSHPVTGGTSNSPALTRTPSRTPLPPCENFSESCGQCLRRNSNESTVDTGGGSFKVNTSRLTCVWCNYKPRARPVGVNGRCVSATNSSAGVVTVNIYTGVDQTGALVDAYLSKCPASQFESVNDFDLHAVCIEQLNLDNGATLPAGRPVLAVSVLVASTLALLLLPLW